ncbi:hypothetical protein [Niveispirillum irakense]|uniref:hypothetical protein n=1 Tax=Niveispirillum irakense TaxID=34011 RepID=UPI0003F8844C|nr:hypothetical protein [Niveispirillum irakense]
MSVSSTAGYASALSLLQTLGNVQVEQLRQSADQMQQTTQALQTGTMPAATEGRGQIVDLLA